MTVNRARIKTEIEKSAIKFDISIDRFFPTRQYIMDRRFSEILILYI